MSETITEVEVRGDPRAEQGLVARIIGVFTSPGKTFEDVARKPTILLPMLVFVVAFAAVQVPIAPIQANEQADLFLDSPRFRNLPEATKDQVLVRLDAGRNISTGRAILNSAGAGIFILLPMLIYSLVLWGAGHLLGGEPRFKAVFSMLLLAALIAPVAGTLVKLPLIFMKQSVLGVTISPAIVLPNLEKTSRLFLFLTVFFDFFYIWGVAVGGIGLAKVAKISTAAGIASVTVLYLVRSTVLFFLIILSLGL